MASFQDAGGRDWSISFDAFMLTEIRKETEIDLADISSGGWLKVETDSAALGQVVAILCRDEIKQRSMTAREFIKLMRGKAIEAARKAMSVEGADFFPPSEWSAIRSNLTNRMATKNQAEQMRTAMEVMEAMGPDFKQGAMLEMMQIATQAAKDGMNSHGSSPVNQSASGLADILSLNAIDAPANAESQPED